MPKHWAFNHNYYYLSYDQVTLGALGTTKSPSLSNVEPVQYLEGW